MNRGFTLIEIVISLALMSALLGVGLFATMDAYRGWVARSERDVLVSLLERARSRAMSNAEQSAWGVCSRPPHYFLFKGTECGEEGRSEAIAASAGTSVSGLEGISFAQQSGTTSGATISIKQEGREDFILINYEGAISWQSGAR